MVTLNGVLLTKSFIFVDSSEHALENEGMGANKGTSYQQRRVRKWLKLHKNQQILNKFCKRTPCCVQ